MLPKPEGLSLIFFLDEGVPNAVGHALSERGHKVHYGNKELIRGSPDQVVCMAALNQGAILVAADHDMKQIAKANGVTTGRFKTLSLVHLKCRIPGAAAKIRGTISLIEHEWLCREGSQTRRIWLEIQENVIRIVRD